MIRKLQMSDGETAEAIWYLQHVAFREELKQIGMMHKFRITDTVESLQQSEEEFLGYYQDGEWIGALSWSLKDVKLMIHRLMVHPDYFRRGIASALLSEVLTQESHEIAEVYVSENNDPAMQLYRKFSFIPLKRYTVSAGIDLIQCIRASKK